MMSLLILHIFYLVGDIVSLCIKSIHITYNIEYTNRCLLKSPSEALQISCFTLEGMQVQAITG